jgi:hypothetical protein
MTKLLFAALVTISAVVAILASAPGPAKADEIIYWSNREGDQLVRTDVDRGSTKAEAYHGKLFRGFACRAPTLELLASQTTERREGL